MWRKLPWVLVICVGLIVIITVGVAAWLLQQKSDEPGSSLDHTLLNEREERSCGIPSAESVAATELVQITASGFNPPEVAIKVGQTIRWENKNVSAHRVVVEPHPLHNECIGLDSKDLDPEQSFGFTFTKPGTWHVHDETQTTNQAKIIVTE